MIRFAEERDTSAVRALFDQCFPDESGFNAYFFDRLYRPEQTLLYEQGNTLCAMVQMLPYQLFIGGTEGTATYIYGACTHPEHRRKHFMAQLLEASFEEDRRRGRCASLLIPQEEWLFQFYRPFGYIPVFGLERKISQTKMVFESYALCDCSALLGKYGRMANNRNGTSAMDCLWFAENG